MTERKICTVSYLGLDREGWIENRDNLLERQPESGFINLEALEKSGRRLCGKAVPRSFVDVGEIEY